MLLMLKGARKCNEHRVPEASGRPNAYSVRTIFDGWIDMQSHTLLLMFYGNLHVDHFSMSLRISTTRYTA